MLIITNVWGCWKIPGPPNDLDLLLRIKRFNLLHQNVPGLFKNFDLVSDLRGNNNTIDILTLSETHIRPRDKVSDLNVTGYKFLSLPRKTGSRGGIGLYIWKQHDFKHREDLDNAHLESIWIDIFSQKSKSFLVYTIYRPLENSKHLYENFAKRFDDMLSLAMRIFKELILLGDMNVNYLVKDGQNEIELLLAHTV